MNLQGMMEEINPENMASLEHEVSHYWTTSTENFSCIVCEKRILSGELVVTTKTGNIAHHWHWVYIQKKDRKPGGPIAYRAEWRDEPAEPIIDIEKDQAEVIPSYDETFLDELMLITLASMTPPFSTADFTNAFNAKRRAIKGYVPYRAESRLKKQLVQWIEEGLIYYAFTGKNGSKHYRFVGEPTTDEERISDAMQQPSPRIKAMHAKAKARAIKNRAEIHNELLGAYSPADTFTVSDVMEFTEHPGLIRAVLKEFVEQGKVVVVEQGPPRVYRVAEPF